MSPARLTEMVMLLAQAVAGWNYEHASEEAIVLFKERLSAAVDEGVEAKARASAGENTNAES